MEGALLKQVLLVEEGGGLINGKVRKNFLEKKVFYYFIKKGG